MPRFRATEVIEMTSAKGRSRAARSKRPRCARCGRPIHRPAGWSAGAATRRHYWARHREVMQKAREA